MLYVIIYCFLLFVLLVYSAVRKKLLGTFLVLLFFTSGIFSLWGVSAGLFSHVEITLFPFVFLFIGYLLYLYPFLSENAIEYKMMSFSISYKACYAISLVYTAMVIISMISFLPQAKSILATGNWSQTRQTLYAGDLRITSSNIIIHACSVFSIYLYFFSTLLSYFMLSHNKKRMGLLMLASSQTIFCLQNIITASRGILLYQVLYNIIFYFFFLRRQKAIVHIITLIIGIISAFYAANILIDITNDRFGENEAIDSIIDYLGQPSIIFNYGIYHIKRHLWGDYALGNLLGSRQFDPNIIGGDFGIRFYTFIGFLYIDWGILGTIFLGLLSVVFFSIYLKKKTFRISECYLLLEYYRFLLDGFLVIGAGILYRLISILLIYCMVVVLERLYPQKEFVLTQDNVAFPQND